MTPFGVVYHCLRCKGRMVGLATLKHDHISRRFLSVLWQSAQEGRAPPGRACPHCDKPMGLIRLPPEYRSLELDVCRHCFCVWFDPSEYGQMPHEAAGAPAKSGAPASPRAREAAAMLALDRVKHQQQMAGQAETGGPEENWKILPAIFGMPVEVDAPPLAARPVMTWGLAGVLVAVFLLTRTGADAVVRSYGFVPGEWDRLGGLTLLTSFFLHGGWLHLLGNLYFLLIFGDNVEDRLGKVRFLLLTLGAHLAGAALHGALEPRGDVPVIGASAGIFGLVACYAIAFPQVKLAFFLRFRWVRVPAWFMLGFYLVLQLAGAYGQVKGFGSVSSLGHLGGIAVGVFAAVLCRMSQGQRQEKWFKSERGRPV
jgi:membrane associated rhomboid family serine protease